MIFAKHAPLLRRPAILPCSLAREPISLSFALRRAPFIIFAKHTPLNLPCYDASVDFSYRYVNDMMAHWSGQSPESLTRGYVNAKTAFPLDFEPYFEDDMDVCLHYRSPLNKAIIEGWQPPQMDSLVHARKTACMIGDKLFVLGCSSLFDEMELGVSSYRAADLPPALHPLADTLPADAVWEHLPHATFMVASMEDDEVLDIPRSTAPAIPTTALNSIGLLACELETLQWASARAHPRPLKSLIDNCLRKVRSAPGAECWEFGGLHLGSLGLMRVWVWRPLKDRNFLAISIRPHFDTVPEVVRRRLLLGHRVHAQHRGEAVLKARGAEGLADSERSVNGERKVGDEGALAISIQPHFDTMPEMVQHRLLLGHRIRAQHK
ncbi:hypothetical protein T492DRAFT_840926 [Pavlovales sp. CCMP2436]|nr:hypothetical protein T492DRAFT_840926 [Pavlovales sp. CCMP2436]